MPQSSTQLHPFLHFSVSVFFFLFSHLVLTICSFCTLFFFVYPFFRLSFCVVQFLSSPLYPSPSTSSAITCTSQYIFWDLSCLLPLLFSPSLRWVGPDCDWSTVARCLGMFPFLCMLVCVCECVRACVGGCMYCVRLYCYVSGRKLDVLLCKRVLAG